MHYLSSITCIPVSITITRKKEIMYRLWGIYPWGKDFPTLFWGIYPSTAIYNPKTEFYIYDYWWAPLYKQKTHSNNHTNTQSFSTKKKKKKEPCKKKLRIAHCEESLIKSSILYCCLALYFSSSCLQRGQQDIIRSHWSTHLRWNIWEHGNCLTSSMSLYLARHIQHSCQYHNTNIRRRQEKSLGRWSSMAFQLMLWLHADKVV